MIKHLALAAAALTLLAAGAASASSSIQVSASSITQNGKTVSSTTVVTNGQVQVFEGVSSIAVFGVGNKFAISFPTATSASFNFDTVRQRSAAVRERIARLRGRTGG